MLGASEIDTELEDTPTGEQPSNASSMRTDEDLLMDYVANQTRQAFEELVHRYERELYNFLRKYLRSADLAEDAFQATFLNVHRKCRQFNPARQFRPWLFRIATNQAIDLFRRNRCHRALSLNLPGNSSDSSETPPLQDLVESKDIGPCEQAESAEEQRRVTAALDEIPAHLREVLVLVMVRGLRYQEAADLLGIPLGSVKSRLNRAAKRLAQQAQRATGHTTQKKTA